VIISGSRIVLSLFGSMVFARNDLGAGSEGVYGRYMAMPGGVG